MLQPGLAARTRREDWQVSLVDELTSKALAREGTLRQDTVETNALHQVLTRTRAVGGHQEITQLGWSPDGNLLRRVTPGVEDVTYLHDVRDRLVQIATADRTTDLILDPLGRLVAKVVTSPDGAVRRAYLHDGDQVVEEHASVAGQTGIQLDRRHHWGRWIDDLVAEEVDTDHDGGLETTLWPITDLLGNVELLTDVTGRILERMTYDPDGTPHVVGEDTTRPSITRIAWTGNGAGPADARAGGVEPGLAPARAMVSADALAVTPQAFEIGLSEPIDDASLVRLVATLTPDGGVAQTLTASLTPDRRGLVLTGATLAAGQGATLHLEGLADPTGNAMLALDETVTPADDQAYAVLVDTAAPRLTAVLDTTEGLLLAFDEPVVPASGTALGSAVTVTHSGLPVEGTTTRVAPNVLAWSPASMSVWQPGVEVRLAAVHVTDTSAAANPLGGPALPLAFTHLTTDPAAVLVAYAAPTDGAPRPMSAYGVTTLFQGRDWHADLGLYHYRARWYDPSLANFLERDPAGHADSPSRYQAFQFNSLNVLDPSGAWDVAFHWYVVYYLASLAMTDQETIERIAWASQYVDDDDLTQPVTPVWGSLRFHFPDESGRGTLMGGLNEMSTGFVNRAIAQRDSLAFGIALHSYADTYSHSGYTWKKFGHWQASLSEAHRRKNGLPKPDSLRGDPWVAAATAAETYSYLRAFAGATGAARPGCDPSDVYLHLGLLFSSLPTFGAESYLREIFLSWGVEVPWYTRSRVLRHVGDLSAYARARDSQGAAMTKAVKSVAERVDLEGPVIETAVPIGDGLVFNDPFGSIW